MIKSPAVSVICACYNQANYVIQSLESIKKQTFQDFEIIIWDDASKDNSVEQIEKWIANNPQYHIQFVKHTENKGICASLNECFKLTKGKYIQLLALDDVILPSKLEKHVDILEHSKDNQALVYTDVDLIGEKNEIFTNKFIAYHCNYLHLESGNYYKLLLERNFIPAMSLLLKRSVIEDVGLWDESLTFEDYDMLLRIAKKYDFIFDGEISAQYRLHAHNTHKKQNFFTDSEFDIYVKHASEDGVKAKLFNMIEYYYLNNTLKEQQKIYYSIYGISNFRDKLLYRNKYQKLYLFSKLMNKVMTKLKK